MHNDVPRGVPRRVRTKIQESPEQSFVPTRKTCYMRRVDADAQNVPANRRPVAGRRPTQRLLAREATRKVRRGETITFAAGKASTGRLDEHVADAAKQTRCTCCGRRDIGSSRRGDTGTPLPSSSQPPCRPRPGNYRAVCRTSRRIGACLRERGASSVTRRFVTDESGADACAHEPVSDCSLYGAAQWFPPCGCPRKRRRAEKWRLTTNQTTRWCTKYGAEDPRQDKLPKNVIASFIGNRPQASVDNSELVRPE